MATRTTYTSTISVPSYASWKCEKCGEINFAVGTTRCQQQESTTSFRNSKQEEAKLRASDLVHTHWTDHVLKIMLEPNQMAQEFRKDFSLENTDCTKCGAKPRWDKDMKYLSWLALSFTPAIFSGIVAIAAQTNIVAWLIFIGLLSVIIYGVVSESSYKKMMKTLPKEYIPVIGSLNQELVEYANKLGKKIPTPDESIEIVKAYDLTSY